MLVLGGGVDRHEISAAAQALGIDFAVVVRKEEVAERLSASMSVAATLSGSVPGTRRIASCAMPASASSRAASSASERSRKNAVSVRLPYAWLP